MSSENAPLASGRGALRVAVVVEPLPALRVAKTTVSALGLAPECSSRRSIGGAPLAVGRCALSGIVADTDQFSVHSGFAPA
jgi:hypothetical protein